MTFKETIDTLVRLYTEGMRANSYNEIKNLRLEDGICITVDIYELNDICSSRKFKKYKPKTTDKYWFPQPYRLKYDQVPFAKIKELAIKPRLQLLKRIQKDLEKNESKPTS